MKTPLYPARAIRQIEQAAMAQWPAGTLMARAGAAVARLAQQLGLDRPGTLLILVGPGNNGGDALVAARLLLQQGQAVQVVLLDDPRKFSGDALNAWRQWETIGPSPCLRPEILNLHSVSLIIDGLFGIGLNASPRVEQHSTSVRPLPALAVAWISQINASNLPVLAIDIPSGLNADTGVAAPATVSATTTLSFIGHKPGLYTGDGPDYCGHIIVDDLQIDRDTFNKAGQNEVGQLNGPDLFAHALAPRRRNSHKGQFGSLGVLGGNNGMVGAVLLAARMGLHAGAGRVYVQLLGKEAPGFDTQQPELMLRKSLHELSLQAMVAGPGMGTETEQTPHLLLAELLLGNMPLVLDADALNNIARQLDLREAVARRTAPTLLTPHPLEAARLLDAKVAEIQADRIGAALELARHYQSIVILKGAGSIIAHPDGAWVINPTGNPALSTGGTGDVLAGLLGALLAQNMPCWPAALAATWLHGKAADQLVAQGVGPIGLTASELIPAIRSELNQWHDKR